MLILKLDVVQIIGICLLAPIVLIFVLVIVAFIIAITKRIKMARLYPKGKTPEAEDLSLKLEDALGKDNVCKVEKNMSRLAITVKAIDLVDGEKLKTLGASGVLLVGNEVKCSFKNNLDQIYQLLSKGSEHE